MTPYAPTRPFASPLRAFVSDVDTSRAGRSTAFPLPVVSEEGTVVGKNRTIYHPIQRDRVTFLKTAHETNNAMTLVEIELAPGGGNASHYHKSYSERFTALVGDLGVQMGKKRKTLRPGESVLVEPGTVHRFYNPSDKPIRFLVEIAPGSIGFEDSLHVAYGLARDNEVNAAGVPKNLLAVALLVEWSDTRMVGPLALLGPFFGYLAALGRRRGFDADLIVRYVPNALVDIAR